MYVARLPHVCVCVSDSVEVSVSMCAFVREFETEASYLFQPDSAGLFLFRPRRYELPPHGLTTSMRSQTDAKRGRPQQHRVSAELCPCLLLPHRSACLLRLPMAEVCECE